MEGLAKGIKMKSGGEAVAEVIGILFMSRTYAHMAHLKTPSFAAHKALNGFYDDVVGIADCLAEAGQGKFGKLDIPVIPMSGNVDKPIQAMESHMESVLSAARGCSNRALMNIIDEIEGLYLKTLYLLRELS